MKPKLKLTASISAALFLACGVSACNRFQSTESLISEAKQYQQKGDTAAAEIQLKNALQKNPDNMEARFLLGQVSLFNGDGPSAEKEFRKAISLGAKPEQVMPFLMQTLLMQNQFQKALDETASMADRTDLAPWRGNAYLGLGQTAQAKTAFDLALKDNPNLPVALIGLARSALIDKDLPTASNYTDQAISKNPGNIDVLMFKANLLRDQGDTEASLAVLNQVLAARPEHVDARVAKADIEIRQKKFDAAREDIAVVQKNAPKNLIGTHMQAVLDFSQGKNADALTNVQKVLAAAPEFMPAVLLAGAIQYNLGSMPQAELHLNKYLEQNPNDVAARKLLASTMLKSGQKAKAASILEPLLKANQQDPELLSLAGEVAMENKDFSKASEYFEKAVALAPKSANYRMALGLSNLGLGQGSSAVAQLEAATTLDAKSSQAGILLIATQMRLKNYDKALAAVNVLEKTLTDNPLLYNLKGVAYLNKNQNADATAAFQKALSIDPAYFPAVANLAQIDLKENKPDDARKRFEAFLDKNKKNVQAMSALAGLALFKNNKDEATKWLERASSENPDSVPASMQLIKHTLQFGDKQKGLTMARNLQSANPTDPAVLDLLAQAQFANNDKQGALNSYQRLTNLAPDSAPAQLQLASAQMAMGDVSAASESVKKALVLQPDFIDAAVFQSSLYTRAGDTAKAVAVAKRMQKQPGQAAMGYEMEGNILTYQKKPELAAGAFEQAFNADRQNVRVLMKLHGSLVLAGKTAQADTFAAQWFKDHPDDAAFHVYLGESYLAQKAYKPAVVQYELALKQQPNDPGILNNLAWLYQQERDPRALATSEKAVAALPDSPPVLDTLGWILVEQGNLERGVKVLQKASDGAPEATDISYHLAAALVQSGDKIKARSILEKMLASGKPFPQMDDAKALLKKI
ncbi:PEP-CTERM system TPR-repeat protein PrsT [Herbaspirillum lusitanum]|uniref:PEP-CTERM system TPR-repeat protein PrsT n=1 Tax=Herbaspirillum lusitanum TaxID=213312 RepID=A0ABW9A573_9BURK